MNAKWTGALFLLLAALCAGYWGMTRYEASRQVRQEVAKRLFAFEPGAIREVEVTRIDEVPVAAAHDEKGQWNITRPNAAIEPNPVVWDRLITALAGMTNERTIGKDAATLGKYALDNPVLVVNAKTATGETVEVKFGAVDPTQTFRYAVDKNGTIFLAAQKAFQEMDRPLGLLRNPYALKLGKEEVTRLEFARFWRGKAAGDDAAKRPEPGQESVVVVVEKSSDGMWRIASPVEALANQEVINELVKQVQFAVGTRFIDEPKNLEDYGLNPPKARVTLQAKGQSPQTLLLGSFETQSGAGKEGGLYAKNAANPAVFVMDPTILNLLPRTPDAFRESRLLSHAVLDIQSVHYVAGETDVTLQNDADKGWVITNPAGMETDQVAVSNYFTALKTLQGRGFPGEPKPEFGLDKPVVCITLSYKGTQPPSVIRVGAPSEDKSQYYAMQDNGIVTMLNQLDVTALTKPLFYFQKKDLLAFEKTNASRITIAIDGASYVLDRVHGQWAVREPQGHALESPSDMDALIKVLSLVRADAVESPTAPADLAAYGLDAPGASVSVTLTSADTPPQETIVGPLSIGKPTSDDSQQRYAMSPLMPGVYRVGQALLDEIRESLKRIR